MRHFPTLFRTLCSMPCALCVSAALAIDAPENLPYEPDHCIGVIWERQKVVDLVDFLPQKILPILNQLKFEANGEPCPGNKLVLSFWPPRDLCPDIYYVAIIHKPNGRILDVMWLVANSPDTKNQFDAWYAANTNTAWTAALPSPYASITIADGVATDPEPPGPNGSPRLWDAPHRLDSASYLHHNAVWEMRTTMTNSCGNQATYDVNGNLIRSTIAAGTSDSRAPYDGNGNPRKNFGHVIEDVHPYIRALQLDGNPVRIKGVSVWFPFALSRPCLHQGEYTEKYLRCRPTTLP